MHWSTIEGNWQRYKASAHARWGEITLDELDLIAGRRERLTGQIHAVYGISRGDAEAQVRRWLDEQASAEALDAANS